MLSQDIVIAKTIGGVLSSPHLRCTVVGLSVVTSSDKLTEIQ